MGNILMLPINFLSAIGDKGISYWVVYWFCYLYLTFIERHKKPRLQKYDLLAHGDPEKQGFYIPVGEEKLEWPQRSLKKQECDSVYIFGVNSKSECLSVRLTHVSDTEVSCSLYLNLHNGIAYSLPEKHINQIRTDEPDTFGSSRLKMQCILPMRKWRIFFNGMLREVKSGEENSTTQYRHVRFALLYSPSSGVFDFTDNMSKKYLADAVANSSTFWKINPKSIFKSIANHINAYEHPGMMHGTYTIENGIEQELFLWGSRGHSFGELKTQSPKDSVEFPWKCYAQLENGVLIQIAETGIQSETVPKIIYGYVMRQNGFIFPIETCQVVYRSPEEIRINCSAETYNYTIIAEIKNNPFGNINSNPFNKAQNIRQIDVIANGMKGKGILFLGREIQRGKNACEKYVLKDMIQSTQLSTPLWERANGYSGLTGGKGSSLYHLFSMKDGYTVPNGVIVTTNGYDRFMNKDLIKVVKELEKMSPFLSSEELSLKCEKTVLDIKQAIIPDSVRNSVIQNLEKVFKDKVNDIKFAIRSSATGEDTEQMSAAGQMDTFLGIQGTEQILDAVRKCWASQFAFVAVQYKRQYGQELNTPMAVVIQEMVSCDVAGVAFSCDPLTGNPSFPSVTANYGLGESVVSAAAEPDTIVLKRELNDEIHIHSQQIGSKKIKIMMDETSGIKEIGLNDNESDVCCINDEMAKRLGKLVVMLENKFGNPRDIEWGIKDGEIYLFQCRPVTSLDRETEYEIRHFGDSYIRTEKEYLSTANVGEVMPGATSNVGTDFMTLAHTYTMARHKIVNWEGEEMPDNPYYVKRIAFSSNHIFFCILDAFFGFSDSEDGNSDYTKAISLALFGRILDDPEINAMSMDRHSSTGTSGGLRHFFKSILTKGYIFTLLFFAGHFGRRAAKEIDRLKLSIKKNSSSMEALDFISMNFFRLYPCFSGHMDITFSSPLWNHAVLSILVRENGGWNNAVYSDFAYLLSTLSNVESADVPAAVQALSLAMSKSVNKDEFSKMSVENAVSWLKSSPSDAGKKFRQFLENHGHRCLNEFDLYSKPWGTDARPLVKILQENVGKGIKEVPGNKTLSYSEIFSKMTIKVGFLSRILLRITLPFCRRGVRDRENSKSALIKGFDKIRKLVQHLAETMVAEGRLPNAELLYFISFHEIKRLIETRSPRIVSRAFRRWKCQPELDRLIYPEICCGIPKPFNLEEDIIEAEDGFTMTGVPVSRGVVKATARVVVKLEDAKNIQPGDVLITYSTDIGWSPYFPLLSGVVTELGGLISHGAVVAREYGLPCVVNLHGAIRAFKSGDLVLLNGTEGFLKKIKSA